MLNRSEEVELTKEILKLYHTLRSEIKKRLQEFRKIGDKGRNKQIFAELCYCLCTPQSKAKNCDRAISRLRREELLFKGNVQQIAKVLKGAGVRFHNSKAQRIVEARAKFSERTNLERLLDEGQAEILRDYFVKNVKGFGYKEASHFLRNVGLGKDFAILDRHTLENLKVLNVIEEGSHPISAKKYLQVEKKMKNFSTEIGIPMEELDLVLWAMETGEVFK